MSNIDNESNTKMNETVSVEFEENSIDDIIFDEEYQESTYTPKEREKDADEINDIDESDFVEDEADFFEEDGNSRQEVTARQLAARWIKYGSYLILITYILAVLFIDYKRGVFVVVMTVLVIGYKIYKYISKVYLRRQIKKLEKNVIDTLEKADSDVKIGGPILVIMFVVMTILGLFAVREAQNLSSVIGIFGYIFLSWIFSHNRKKIIWRPVIGAIFFQYIFGYIVIQSEWGLSVIRFTARKTQALLDFTFEGSGFVYGYLVDESLNSSPIRLVNGDSYTLNPPLFFYALQSVIFFSSLISVLYYLNFLQFVVSTIGFFLSIALGTSASESIASSANIFVGQTEAPLIIKPFINEMTESELHAIMTGGFATIAGSVFGVYISLGIDAEPLLAASLMSAPAALAISKILFPETEVSKTSYKIRESWVLPKSNETSLVQAASVGAIVGGQLVLNVAANLVSILAIIRLLDSWLIYFGELIDISLSFNAICEVLFYPLVWFMGIESRDLRNAATLIGYKIFANEFVAYQLLVFVYKERLKARSYYILTYAICGFSNIGSIGIQLGLLTHLAPEKEQILSKLVTSAMIAGNIACFLTACIAGLFYQDTEE